MTPSPPDPRADTPAGQPWHADMAVLDSVHERLEQQWATHPQVGEDDRVALTLAVAELVANVVEHGGAASLWLEVAVDGDTVIAVIDDDGEPVPARIDSELVSEDPWRETGRGMALARFLADLTYERRGDRNRWVVARRPGGRGG